MRYRRIPNVFVLATLFCGLLVNGIFGGLGGVAASVGGCLFGFALMLLLHVFGAMGAGDVKLFAAIGSVLGAQMVLPTFLVVLITINTLVTKPNGAKGIARGTRVPAFAVPLVTGHLLGTADVASAAGRGPSISAARAACGSTSGQSSSHASSLCGQRQRVEA